MTRQSTLREAEAKKKEVRPCPEVLEEEREEDEGPDDTDTRIEQERGWK